MNDPVFGKHAARPELAVLGGSFDPPHVGHVMLAAYALLVSRVERVLVAPAFAHAFGKSLTVFEHRFAMCELAFGELARVEITPIERELGGTSRTLRLVQALEAAHPAHQLRLLIGADILHEAHLWQAFDEVCARAPLLVAGRAGFPHPAVDPRAPVLPDVSSTLVRETLLRGEDVSPWVPVRVVDYIRAHGLYRGADAP